MYILLYNDEGLPEENMFNKIASEYKNKFQQNSSEEEIPEQTTREFDAALNELFFLLSQNEIYLTQIKNVLKKTRYRVSAYMSGVDDAILKTQNHKNKLLSVNPNLTCNVSSEQKQYKFYNAKTSILNCCNNSSDILKTLLFFMLLKNIVMPQGDVHKIAEDQVEILKTVINLL